MKPIFSLLFIMLLWGCGNNDLARGGGVDIPNSITATVLDSNGLIQRNAKVRLVSVESWVDRLEIGSSVVIDSTWTDSLGRFTMENPENGRANLEVATGVLGKLIQFDTSVNKITLEKLGQLKAIWKPGARLQILGTPYLAVANEEGEATFEGVPSLQSGLVGTDNSISVLLSTVSLKRGEKLNLGVMTAQTDSLLLDDFERASVYSYLDSWLKGSLWYSLADENDGGESTVFPSTPKLDSWSAALTDSASWQGNSLTVRYDFVTTNITSPYVIVGCELGMGINFEAVDSLVFMAQSEANWILRIGNTVSVDLPPTTGEWQRVVIRKTELENKDDLSVIKKLQFDFSETPNGVFRLDDFIIYGDPINMLRVKKVF